VYILIIGLFKIKIVLFRKKKKAGGVAQLVEHLANVGPRGLADFVTQSRLQRLLCSTQEHNTHEHNTHMDTESYTDAHPTHQEKKISMKFFQLIPTFEQ
jgi:hypothetical protein